jgi:hypothetical protein
VDEAEPVLVELDTRGCTSHSSTAAPNSPSRHFDIHIRDTGGGIPEAALHQLVHYFDSGKEQPQDNSDDNGL